MKCFRCGADETKKTLFDAITADGIFKICEDCSKLEGVPIIKRPTKTQLNELDRKPSVYERLSKAAGINPYAKRSEKSENLIRQETSLREIVERNYREKVKDRAMPREDLIDNFHWKLMVARRMKKLSAKQVGEAIGEPEAAIKMAEQGIIPNDNRIITKLQSFYGVALIKGSPDPNAPERSRAKEFFQPLGENSEISFDRQNLGKIKIADIKNKTLQTIQESDSEDILPQETGYNLDENQIQNAEGAEKPKKKWIFW